MEGKSETCHRGGYCSLSFLLATSYSWNLCRNFYSRHDSLQPWLECWFPSCRDTMILSGVPKSPDRLKPWLCVCKTHFLPWSMIIKSWQKRAEFLTRPAPEISHASRTQTTNPVSAEKKLKKPACKRDFPGILQLWQSKSVFHLQHLDNFIHSFYLWESETPRPISILKAIFLWMLSCKKAFKGNE